jgi:hypothetical protein
MGWQGPACSVRRNGFDERSVAGEDLSRTLE